MPKHAEDTRVSLTEFPEEERQLTVLLENGGTEILRVIEEAGRGGSCIAYRAIVEGSTRNDGWTRIIKEFYPSSRSLISVARKSPSLSIPADIEDSFRRLERRFVTGASRFGDFYEWDQGKHSTAEPLVGTANNTSYAITRLAGEHLLSEDPPLDMNSIAQVMKSVCMALEPFHAHGALYLDAKPSNIYWYEVDGTLHARLFDFDTVVDLSSLQSGDFEYVSRSAGWSSPEQESWAAGEAPASEMSTATDAWSVGAMLFWLVTGRAPTWQHSHGSSDDASLLKNGLFDWANEKRYGLRFDRHGRVLAKIDEIARKTLCRDPASRCGSITELARDFEELCSLTGFDATTIEAVSEMLQQFHAGMRDIFLQNSTDKSVSGNAHGNLVNAEVQDGIVQPIEESRNGIQEESLWGPNRPVFTWASRAQYATINSITDNPAFGDERSFVQIRDINNPHYLDEIEIAHGHIYEICIYYHNGADPATVGKKAIGIADGLAVKSTFPSSLKAGERQVAKATIFASDIEPNAVWDGVYMHSSQDLHLQYVPGTAIIHNRGKLNGSSFGPDYLFGDGALLGYNKISGLLPGGEEYAGYVTYCVYASKYPNAIIGMADPFDPASWADDASIDSGDMPNCAFGPERPDLAMDMRVPTPTFNSIIDNPIVGDERFFVRIGKISPNTITMRRSAEIEQGNQYLVYVYVNNDASPSHNDSSHNHEAVSCATCLSCLFPDKIPLGSQGEIRATISSSNSNPNKIWCSIPLTAKDGSVSLRYVAGSSRIFNNWRASGSVLSSHLFSEDGTLMGLNKLNGVVPGGENYQSVIAFVIQAFAAPSVESSDESNSGVYEAGKMPQEPDTPKRVGWGPKRRTFTNESPAPYPTFNSITNNSGVGDERNFCRIGEYGSKVPYRESIQVEPDKRYEVYIYYQNDTTIAGESGVAYNTRINSSFPAYMTPNAWYGITAKVSSSNTNPPSVWDGCDLWSNTPVQLRYVANSATLHLGPSIIPLSPEDLFSKQGSLIGRKELDGIIPGDTGRESSGYVTYVIEARQWRQIGNGFGGAVEKAVSLSGEVFSKRVFASLGDEVTFKVSIRNDGDIALFNATIKDSLPNGMELMPGTVRKYAGKSESPEKLSDAIAESGIRLGTIWPGNTVHIIYRAIVSNAYCGDKSELTNESQLTYDSYELPNVATVDSASVCLQRPPVGEFLIGSENLAALVDALISAKYKALPPFDTGDLAIIREQACKDLDDKVGFAIFSRFTESQNDAFHALLDRDDATEQDFERFFNEIGLNLEQVMQDAMISFSKEFLEQ